MPPPSPKRFHGCCYTLLLLYYTCMDGWTKHVRADKLERAVLGGRIMETTIAVVMEAKDPWLAKKVSSVAMQLGLDGYT